MEKPGIDLLHLVFYKQPVYKQLALAWQIAKQLSGLNLLSLSNNKNCSLKVTSVTKQKLLKMYHLRHRLEFFYFVEKLFSVLKIFKFLYF